MIWSSLGEVTPNSQHIPDRPTSDPRVSGLRIRIATKIRVDFFGAMSFLSLLCVLFCFGMGIRCKSNVLII